VSSVPEKGRERPYVPEMEQHHLRWRLFEELRKTKTYKTQIALLRPLWKAARHEAEPDAGTRAFQGLKTMSRYRANGDRSALRAYVEAVTRAAEMILHLTYKGRVPTWACNFIHVDVCPESTAHGYAARDVRDGPPAGGQLFGAVAGELRIWVNPQMARLGQSDDQSTWQTIEAGEFMQFDEWDDLERRAIEAMREIIATMRAEFTVRYPKNRRPSTRAQQQTQLEVLAKYLLDGTFSDKVRSSTLQKLATKVIGVEYPRTVNREKS